MPKIPGVNKNNIKTDKKTSAITIFRGGRGLESNPISNKNKTMRNEINIPFLHGDAKRGMRKGCRRIMVGVQRPLDRRTIYYLSINVRLSVSVIFPPSHTDILQIHCRNTFPSQIHKYLVEIYLRKRNA